MNLRLEENWSKFMLLYPQQIQKLGGFNGMERIKTDLRNTLSVRRIQNPIMISLNHGDIKKWLGGKL